MMSVEDYVPAEKRVFLPDARITVIDMDLFVPNGMSPEQYLEMSSFEGGTLPVDLNGYRRDLKRIGEGWTPSDEELRAAPLLDRWGLGVIEPVIAARGFVTGHPLVEDGSKIEIGPVLVFQEDATWIRTLSRFYRLGRHVLDGAWQ